MEKIDLSKRYFELSKELDESKACKILSIKRNLDDSIYIFKKNYEELKEAIELYHSGKLEEWARKKQKNYNSFHLEFQRYLHNFLASVFSLIEHTVVFRKRLDDKQFNDFYEVALNDFLSNKCVAFIKDLRIYSQHYKLPLTTSSRGSSHLISPEGRLMAIAVKSRKIFLGRLALLKEELIKWNGWSRNSKEFISQFQLKEDSKSHVSKIVDIKEVIEIYYCLAEKFYGSVFNKMLELYDTCFRQYEKLRIEMDHVIKLMENNSEYHDHARTKGTGKESF